MVAHKKFEVPHKSHKKMQKIDPGSLSSIIYLHPSYKIKELHKLHTNAPCASPQAPVFLSEFRLRAQDGAKWRKAVPQPTCHKWQMARPWQSQDTWDCLACNIVQFSECIRAQGVQPTGNLRINLPLPTFRGGIQDGETHFWTCVCAYLYASVCVDMQTDMHTYRHTSHYVTSQCRLDWNWHLYNIYMYVHYITLTYLHRHCLSLYPLISCFSWHQSIINDSSISPVLHSVMFV